MKDSLGDRMKGFYEARSQTKLPRRTNAILRVDGRAFHTFTRRFKRPYDLSLMLMMDIAAETLCHEISGAKVAYVQSDEISVWFTDYDGLETQGWFDYEVQKLTSIGASIVTSAFIGQYYEHLRDSSADTNPLSDINEGMAGLLPTFDARVFTIPDPVEVHNYFVWRQNDAERNAIQMICQANFSHRELQGKRINDQIGMLDTKLGNAWEQTMDPGFMRGRVITRQQHGWFPDRNYPRFKDDIGFLLSRVPGNKDEGSVQQVTAPVL